MSRTTLKIRNHYEICGSHDIECDDYLLPSGIRPRAIWLTETNASWVKMEATGSSETIAILHGVISHNIENIQLATVNL
jgi:hypothetical protein